MGKLYVSLREIQPRLFDEPFQAELEQAYRKPRGTEPKPPALLVMVTLLQHAMDCAKVFLGEESPWLPVWQRRAESLLANGDPDVVIAEVMDCLPLVPRHRGQRQHSRSWRTWSATTAATPPDESAAPSRAPTATCSRPG